MRRLPLLLLFAACADTSNNTPPPVVEDPDDTDIPSVCDDGSDGLCADENMCTDDPDCMIEEPPPGCTPNALPAAPTDLTANITGLFRPTHVAAANDRVYIAGFTNATPSSAKIYACPTTGCPATPTSFGTGFMYDRSFLAAIDGAVVWSAKNPSALLATSYPSQVYRANPDGSAPTAVFTASDDTSSSISNDVNVFDGYAVTFDVTDPTPSRGGIRALTSTLMSPPMPGVRSPAYSFTSVAANDEYIAYHADPIGAASTPYDDKIHIYDLDGTHLGASTATYNTVGAMQFVDGALLFHSDSKLYACDLPSCSNARDVGTAVQKRGFTFTVHGGRVYFASVADKGCEQGLDGVLASCAVPALLAGTCTPELHATSFHYVNATHIAIDGTNAYVTSKTSEDVLKAPL